MGSPPGAARGRAAASRPQGAACLGRPGPQEAIPPGLLPPAVPTTHPRPGGAGPAARSRPRRCSRCGRARPAAPPPEPGQSCSSAARSGPRRPGATGSRPSAAPAKQAGHSRRSCPQPPRRDPLNGAPGPTPQRRCWRHWPAPGIAGGPGDTRPGRPSLPRPGRRSWYIAPSPPPGRTGRQPGRDPGPHPLVALRPRSHPCGKRRTGPPPGVRRGARRSRWCSAAACSSRRSRPSWPPGLRAQGRGG